ncbi:MAG: NnrS family protein, partial [Gammaproteobacteria bacterium]|nr:NnrS family protein [Gammaproteobacteria bacterium]
MIQIPALNLGFRIFFLGAGLFALAASIIWLLIYLLGWQLLSTGYPPVVWHGHEMLFGYTLAVVVGFLLTAARNWSGIQTIHGLPLGGLFLIWLLARVAPLTGLPGVTMGMVCDVLFCLLSTLCVAHPILLAKLWRNMGIVLLLFLLFIDNLIFYRGLSTGSDEIMNKSLTAGLWLLLTLVLVMGRRIIPMFIQNGVDESFQPKNRLWVDRACLWGFMTFALLDLLGVSPIVVSLAAALLFVLHFWRWL